ncbi:MAG TPA: TetR/AcrR family transcriptional regulator [Nevskiaceae bacterium]|nr:TetR/AcrR family transcriptional regulator [Nevskiaceae bacterium]
MPSNSPSGPRSLSRAPRGRPKDQDKRAAILAAAKMLFAEQGLAGTSMEGLAAAAGVSKLTLYSHFRNKDELFRQTVIAKCNEHWPENVFDVATRLPLRVRLRSIGKGFLDLVFSDDVMNLYRMMAAEGGRQNRLGRLFWDAGPERTIQRFTQVLDVAVASGELAIPDTRRTAAAFFVMLKGEHHLRVMVGASNTPTPEARQKHIDEIVETFLRIYAP